ncbi:MAG TPA: hypothetical protein VMZ91_09770 [Candidatus Paceibacterota bacterium]|nr:hypothetical protein [Candidatus Paceibacterota bacterium]
MKKEDKEFLISRLLNWYSENYPQPDCSLHDCCGICDKYFACLYFIFEELIKKTKFSEKCLEEFLLNQIKNE